MMQSQGNTTSAPGHYTPTLAAFSQLDPYAGDIDNPISLHRFQYADRDGIQKHDPTGMFSVSISLNALAIAGGHLSIEAQRVRTGGKALGAHAARIVQFSMLLNSLVTSIEEPLIARWVIKARSYNSALARSVITKLPERTQSPQKIITLMKALSGEGIARELYSRYGVPFKLTGFPNFSGMLYRNELGVHRRHSAFFMALRGSRSADKAVAWSYMYANFTGRFRGSIEYAWHHHEVVGIMMYVKARTGVGTTIGHAASHEGGVLYFEICTNRDYAN